MSIWFAMFLGLIQGITEFLPVSSSGHLAIFHNFFGMEDMGGHLLFDVLLHFATLLAIFVFYRKDIWEMLLELGRMFNPKSYRSVKVPPARRLIILVIIATLPLIVAVFFKDAIEQLSTASLIIGIALLATGALLMLSGLFPKGNKDEKTATVLDVICVGLMQCIATIPGLSRSGLTICTGIFRGFDRKFAVKFSFLMSIPAVLGATMLEVKDALADGFDWTALPVYLAGMIVAALVGYLSLCLLRFITTKGSFKPFAYYCFIAGSATILASFIVK